MIHASANHSLACLLPRQKSGKVNACQPDLDLLLPSSSRVQPQTWTMCFTEQWSSWRGKYYRKFCLSAHRRQFLRLPLQLLQGTTPFVTTTALKKGSKHCCFEQSIKYSSACASQHHPSLGSPLCSPTFSFRSTVPAINIGWAYNQDEFELKQGLDLMLFHLSHSVITWSNQSPSYK